MILPKWSLSAAKILSLLLGFMLEFLILYGLFWYNVRDEITTEYAKKLEKLVDPDDPQLGLFDEAKPLSGQQQQKVGQTKAELNQSGQGKNQSTKKVKRLIQI